MAAAPIAPRCECCGQLRAGRSDEEGICLICWRNGIVFSTWWMADLKAAGLDDDGVAEVLGSTPKRVRTLHVHVLDKQLEGHPLFDRYVGDPS